MKRCVSRGTGLLVFIFLLYIPMGWAQIGRVGINTTSPDAMLHVKDSSVLFTGPVTLPVVAEPPPANGAGTRMMWYPQKGAFRAGTVTGPNWDRDSIGACSFAAGYNAKAKGFSSIALGYTALATGNYSVAIGDSTQAIGLFSTAIGYKPVATNNSSFAIGSNTISNGHSSFASGLRSEANAWHSAAIGHYAKANGYSSLVIGLNNDTIVSPQQFYNSTSPLFIIGNGNGPSSPSNALVVRKDGRVGIGTNYPAARLHVQDSSVLFVGMFNGGTSADPPATGPGTRMMWYPDKAAFRAGNVTGSQWDKFNIGLFSFAAGYSTIASDNSAFALGENTTASGYASGAMGWGASASGQGAISLGRSGTANGDYSMCLGYQATANGGLSTAMGAQSMASGTYSTAIGWEAAATSLSSTAIGRGTYASNSYSVAIGRYTQASGVNATALGYSNNATGNYSTSMGTNTLAQGDHSTATGNNSKSKGYASFASGYNTVSNGYSSLVAGMYNDSLVSPQSSITSTTPLFIVGNGSGNTTRSNALVVRKDGRVGIGTNILTELLQVGTTTGDGIRVGSAEVLSDGGANTFKSSGNILPTIDNSYDIGSASFRWDDIWATNGTIQTSDVRSKKDISDLNYSLDDIMKLRPVSYKWKEGHDQNLHIGLIAQEVRQIIPEAVRTTNYVIDEDGSVSEINTERMGLNYASLTPVLVNAIQELTHALEEQQEINEKQNEKILALDARLNEMEQLLSRQKK